MLNSGLTAAFGTLICWTVGTFAFTIASKRADPAAVNRVRLFFAALLLSVVVVLFFKVSFIELFTLPTFSEWIWLGLSGIIGLTLGDYFAFTAYSILGSSRTSLFSTFAPVAALLLGMVILGESINGVGILGMMISTGGIIWFIQSTQKSNDKTIDKSQVLKGIAYAILGAVGQGLGLVCAKKGLNITHQTGADLSAVHATWIRMGIGTLAAYSIAVFKRNVWAELKIMTASKTIITPLLTGTFFGPVMGVSLSLYAASQIPVGIAQTIFSLLPITVLLAATLSGRERINGPSIIAAAICMMGVFVLVWRDKLIALFN
jgi:drug/metabolite transporter (DMT)-like permease